jgi:beta-xylosidase
MHVCIWHHFSQARTKTFSTKTSTTQIFIFIDGLKKKKFLKKIMHFSRSLVAAGLLASSQPGLAVPTTKLFVFNREVITSPLISKDFPDPSIVQDIDGFWYSFATNSNGKHIQIARGIDPLGPWALLDRDALPDGAWTSGRNTWAPDVVIADDGSYVMYYSGELANNTRHHCIGVATASTIVGPYKPRPEPLACPLDIGGAIDPSGFVDSSTKKRYVVYKVDGNSIGNGGDCGNGVEPLVSTPILLQELGGDGVTPIGKPVKILDRTKDDGPLVEAPSLVRTAGGLYVLFFSSGCFSSPRYNVKYAIADKITGPYVRSSIPLLQTGDFGLTAPGGATSVVTADKMVFHANCPAGRCLFAATYTVMGSNIIISNT